VSLGNLIAPIASVAFYVCASCVLIASGIFVRNVMNADREYDLFLRWPARLFLYSITFLVLPPVGLAIGLWLLVFGKSPGSKKFGHGAIFISLVYLLVYLAIFLGTSSVLPYRLAHGM